MKVGFVGLGRMGRGMALNLLGSGVELTVYDMSAQATAPLAAEGATVAGSVGELAREVEVLFTSLPGPAQVEDVVFGADGVLENLKPGLVLFELSTSSVALAHRINDSFKPRGAAILDAPVSGGPAGAEAGQLVIWAGGDAETYHKHEDLLRVIAETPRHVGPIGTGTVTKLVHNLTGYMLMHAMAETFSLATKAGADPLELWKAMRLGLVGKGSPLDMLTKQFLPGTYEPPAFALELAHKDVTLATALGRELGVPMRLASLTMEEMTEAVGRGFGAQDSRAFLKLQLERAGVEIAVNPERLQQAIDELG